MAKCVDNHLVAIIDGNQRHREQVSEAPLSFYAVNTYGDVTNALMGLSMAPPGLILVGEHVPPSRGVSFLKTMRQERELAHTPVIFVSDHGEPDLLQAALKAGASDCLLKPYRRSALIRTVSAQLNAKVERRWKALPALERNALEGTLSIFNSIADVVETCYPIQYWAVAESCSALVDALGTSALSAILEAAKDHGNYTYAHSVRVASLMALFAQTIGLPRSQQLLLATGGLLHDVGKISIRHSVLTKKETLTAQEWETMRGHVASSVQFLKASEDLPKGIITMAAQHHERLDGSGYTNGLKSEQLNELARMVAIADTFAAMTEHHAHKPAMTVQGALKAMTDMTGLLDQKFLGRFREVLLDTLGETAVGENGFVAAR